MAEPIHRQIARGDYEAQAFPIAMRAIVDENVDSADQGVMVTIYIFDGGEIPFGPCPWMPRGTDRPQKGDQALVIMDEQDEAWVIAWWPYDILPPAVEPPDIEDPTFSGESTTSPGDIPPDEGNPTP